MKIGVITWFRYENYGTVLQAVAMQKYLASQGYNPQLVNFQLDDTPKKEKKKKNIIKKIISKFKVIIIRHKYRSELKDKSISFKRFIENNCSLSDFITSNQMYIDICNKYDCLIFGSDQIWNQNWYHPYYFSNFDEIITKRISYAPSFGSNEILDKNELKNALNRFQYLSARELQGKKIISQIVNKDAEIVVDPTLLLDSNEWQEFEEKTKETYSNYILCYMLSDNKNHWNAIKKKAKELNKNIVIIPCSNNSYFKSQNIVADCSIGNYLYLIKNADLVITDSFHGTIFSIIYNKMFYTFERHNPKLSSNQNNRIYNVLELVNAQNALIKYNSNVIDDNNITYNELKSNLDILIDKSKNYLKNALKGEKDE